MKFSSSGSPIPVVFAG